MKTSSSTSTSSAPVLAAADLPVARIRPVKGWAKLGLADLWQYRELVFFLTWRDIKVRYKQTILGVAWAILQPLFAMMIFTLFFGRMAGIQIGDAPYALAAFVALVPWTFFANALTQASNSLVENVNLVKKVFFPRLVIPISSVFSGVVDFTLAFALLVPMMAFFRRMPTANIVWLPLFLLLALVSSLGISLWLSAMNIQFRDVRYTIPFLTQAWLFATPIVYGIERVLEDGTRQTLPEPWLTLWGLNPMTGVVVGFRWALLGDTLPLRLVLVSALVGVVLVVSGTFYFRRMESTFADVS